VVGGWVAADGPHRRPVAHGRRLNPPACTAAAVVCREEDVVVAPVARRASTPVPFAAHLHEAFREPAARNLSPAVAEDPGREQEIAGHPRLVHSDAGHGDRQPISIWIGCAADTDAAV